MIAFCSLTGREMGTDLAQEVLADLWGDEVKVITIEQIQRGVGDFFGLSFLVVPLASEAQQGTKVARIGYLAGTLATSPHLQEVFLQGLRDLGYVEGRNL